jgi:hypothetical protein
MYKRPRDPDAPSEPETLPMRLERLRVENGYPSQLALGRAMGVSYRAVYRHITLGMEPRDEMFEAYARAFQCSVHYVRYGREEERRPPPAVEQYLAEQGPNCPPAVAMRLRRMPWSLVTAGQVDTKHVHRLRLLIDENLSRQASSVDGSAGVPIQTVSGALRRQTGTRNKPRRREESV